MLNPIKLVECPRDAMQGIHEFIPTEKKAAYINTLLKVGFDTIDFGSFVSPKAIPQMRDTADVLNRLQLENSASRLLAIVANKRGAEDACQFDEITYLGFPFSISETFQKRNANAGIDESLNTVSQIYQLCKNKGKELVVYLSMGFGNPYGDPWNPEIVIHWTRRLSDLGIQIISVADTTGMATGTSICSILPSLISEFSETTIGVHLHSTPTTRLEKISAAWKSGCRRFDSAIKGYGGCPFATDELTGNLATEDLVYYLQQNGELLHLNEAAWTDALIQANHVFTS